MGMIENSMLIEYYTSKRLECGCRGRCSCDDDDEREISS